jgi:hypothetical protein
LHPRCGLGQEQPTSAEAKSLGPDCTRGKAFHVFIARIRFGLAWC